MRNKIFLVTMVLSVIFLSGCPQNTGTPKFKVTVTQPANGKIEVTPALPTDGTVDKGSELTFTLSANTGFKVKTLIIGGTAYPAASHKNITKKIKIEKNTEVSAIVEAEANPAPENPGQESPKPNNPQPNPNPNPQPQPNPNPTPSTKYKVTITQPANGKIEVTPALPADGMVDKGKELTFTLSANSGYKVKALTIDGTAYSDITDKRITQKVKIEKNTEVSGTAEAETNPEPSGTETFNDTQGNSVKIKPNKDYNGEIIDYSLEGEIYIEDILSEAFKAKLADLNGKDLNTSKLKINCFATPKRSTQSVTTRNVTNSYISKEITPKILEDVLQLKKRKFSVLTLNNETPNGSIGIIFTTKDTEGNKYFDINNLAKFRFSDTFKLDNSSNVVLCPQPAGLGLVKMAFHIFD